MSSIVRVPSSKPFNPQRRRALTMSVAVGLSAWLKPSISKAAETVETGVLGSYTSGVWPFLIGVNKGMFARRNIAPDVSFAPTAPGLVQQLAAGSLDIVAVNGLAEPLHAVEKGAPVAITRIIGQTPNYVMVGRKNIHNIKELKGKTIAIGGLRDINKIYLDRMMNPNGLHDGDYDIVVIGATAARYAALRSGAIDATMLVPPFNFSALAAGYNSLGLVRDYAKDLPQTSMQASTRWVLSHMSEAKAINDVIDEAVAWLYKPENRNEAIDILATASKTNQKEVAASYDFLISIDFFAHTSEIQPQPLISMMKDMVALGDMQSVVPIDKLVVKGLNQVTK